MSNIQFNQIVNYLKRNKLTSFVNILGLSVGFTVFMLLALYVKYETSFDTNYANSEHTYRLVVTSTPSGGKPWIGTGTPAPLKAEILNQIPDVENVGRLFRSSEEVFQYEDLVFEEQEAFYGDQEIIDILDLKITRKNKESPLSQASCVIMSESTARRYFGESDPLGEIISLSWGKIEVSGIFKDLPKNIHARPDLLISYNSPWWIKLYNDDKWDFFWLSYYLTAKPGSNPDAIANKIESIFDEVDNPSAKKGEISIELQQISDIHLEGKIPNEKNAGDIRIIKALKGIALFILLIVLINYINLASAQILERSAQVGIRKVLGISKLRLIKGFTFEAALFQITSIIAAFILINIFIPPANNLLNCDLNFGLFSVKEWLFFGILLIVAVSISVSYPVMIMLSFNPVSCLKEKFIPTSRSAIIRKALISFQFFISFALIFGTMVFYRQSDYLIHKDIGINTRNMLIVRAGHVDWDAFPAKKNLFKAEMEKHPGVLSITNSNSIPGNGSYISFVKNKEDAEAQTNYFSFFDTDHDFIKTMGLKIIAGRDFSKEYSRDIDAAIITRNGLDEFGFSTPQDALGKEVICEFDQKVHLLIGVCEDFQLSNLKSRGYPVLIRISENQNRFISIRYSSEDEKDILRATKENWKIAFGDLPIRYFYLDENYRAVYASEILQTKIISAFSIIAVILAALGLFGMTYFIVVKREKEFSIRKVNGAVMRDVFILVARGFIQLIAISSLLALPIAWWLSAKWLNNYPVHINISWWYYFIPFSLLGLVTLITISFHTVKTARVNPASLLRSE